MSPTGFMLVMTVSAALLALWTGYRFPAFGPHTLTSAVVAVIVAGIVLQLTLPAAVALIRSPFPLAPLVGVVGLVLPMLTLGFLSGFWVMRACIGSVGGSVR